LYVFRWFRRGGRRVRIRYALHGTGSRRKSYGKVKKVGNRYYRLTRFWHKRRGKWQDYTFRWLLYRRGRAARKHYRFRVVKGNPGARKFGGSYGRWRISWRRVPGAARQIEANDYGEVVTVNKHNHVHGMMPGKSGWYRIPGSLKTVAISNAVMVGVHPGGNLWRKRTGKTGKWQHLGKAAMTDIAVNNRGDICGVNKARRIFCRSANTKWKQVQGHGLHRATTNCLP